MGDSRQAARFSFAQASNASYIEKLYEQFKQDPASVDESWQSFFAGCDFASANSGQFVDDKEANLNAKVEALINAYRRLGHLSADLNPLDSRTEMARGLSLEENGLDRVDPSKQFYPANLPDDNGKSLQEILEILQQTYCGKIGADFRELNDPEQIVWFQQRMETCRNKPTVEPAQKLRIFEKLVNAEGFEKFLQARYLGQKRFSLEGVESLIPMLDVMIDEASNLGAEEICMGMAHRGRLNVLANTLGKSYDLLLKEFEGSEFFSFDIDGDVKYHLGFVNQVKTHSGNSIDLFLCPNPSHLEAVNPVVTGFCNSRQRIIKGGETRKIVPVLLHGDASFIGQGVVAETFNLANLNYYGVGGTIHVVINNQIGFTTLPGEGRSCEYSSDVAKIVRAPVLHVNADDPEAVIWSMQLAVRYRQEFGKDIVIDLIGYRRHGHNETDEPGFTQPLMYQKISKHPTVLTQYMDRITKDGTIPAIEAKAKVKGFRDHLQSRFETVRSKGKTEDGQVTPSSFKNVLEYRKVPRKEVFDPADTAVSKSDLKKIADSILEIPDGFNANPKIKRLFEQREKMLDGSGAVDWAFGELLAFGSLLQEGKRIRLSGQDCRRGTFSSRHAVIFDAKDNKPHNTLAPLSKGDIEPQVINSPLSEMGVMGFEFGYSVADEDSLVLWEAQFGDFANGAQVIVDQFLVASEAKWKQTCGLTLLLPHGHEGAGPEHSSGRPERFLQLCGNLNIQVAIPTTAAQYFHILRRQMHRNFRKPLVIMTPKSLLRANEATSTWKEFTKGGFKEVLHDPEITASKKSETLILCSGKIYYEIVNVRHNQPDALQIPVGRVEQLYPFPEAMILEYLKSFPSLKEVIWVQEEPQNMGAWNFIRARLESVLLDSVSLKYIGRKNSGTTAEGSKQAHEKEQKRIIYDALGLACSWQPA